MALNTMNHNQSIQKNHKSFIYNTSLMLRFLLNYDLKSGFWFKKDSFISCLQNSISHHKFIPPPPCIFSLKMMGTEYIHIYIYSQTSVPRTRLGRIPWMAQTDLKVRSIFPICLSKKNSFRSNTDTSNSQTQ